MHLRRRGRVDAAQARLPPGRRSFLGRPVVGLRRARETANVLPFPATIRLLEMLVRDVSVLVPLFLLLGDAEVDEGAVPEIREAHRASILALFPGRDLVMEQRLADPDERRAFLDCDAVVL